jgi:hypothetical protein
MSQSLYTRERARRRRPILLSHRARVFALSAFSMTVDKNIAQCDAAFAHFLRMCADEVVLASQTANCIRPIQSCNPCLRSFEFRVRQRRLSIDSVRFMQNHDTIVPPGPFCGKSYVQVRSLMAPTALPSSAVRSWPSRSSVPSPQLADLIATSIHEA